MATPVTTIGAVGQPAPAAAMNVMRAARTTAGIPETVVAARSEVRGESGACSAPRLDHRLAAMATLTSAHWAGTG